MHVARVGYFPRILYLSCVKYRCAINCVHWLSTIFFVFSDNQKCWAEFIQLYTEQSALWDVRSEGYSNKQVKSERYAVLMKKTKEVFPAADEEFVKSKIESLKASS
nr:unnamed protein product [Callosobruchus analis]